MIYWVIVFSSLGSIAAISGAFLILKLTGIVRLAFLPQLLSYATGTLLGAAFLGMIPSALVKEAAAPVSAAILLGIVIFFALEKLLIWRHSHDRAFASHKRAGTLILVGDAVHNAADGLVIASAFLVSVPLGVAVSLAVIAHELPQELGDFVILLDAGLAPSRAFAFNMLSALPTIPAAVLGFYWLETAQAALPFVLALSSASFIYIAIGDLIPSLQGRGNGKAAIVQLALLLSGIATIAGVQFLTSGGKFQWSY